MAAGFLFACSAQAQTFIITERPALPRGKPGTFHTLWTQRVAPHPSSGIASWYDDNLTATGKLNVNDPAMCSHPDPSELHQVYKVTRGNRSITCRVVDIGPHKRLKRAIDLTPAGFKALGMKVTDGLGHVKIERE